MKTDIFRTSDIVLAACLKINDYQLVTIERNGSKGIFVFAEVPDDFVSDFDLGKVRVEPVEFNNTIKTLTTAVRRMRT